MVKIKFFSSLVAVILIATLSVGLTSCCKDKKEPEPDLSGAEIMGKWYTVDKKSGLEFMADNTYSYKTENETVNGLFKIKERENGTYSLDHYVGEKIITYTYDAILYKMLASGSNVYDQLWVYNTDSVHFPSRHIVVHFYSGNKLVQNSGGFMRDMNEY